MTPAARASLSVIAPASALALALITLTAGIPSARAQVPDPALLVAPPSPTDEATPPARSHRESDPNPAQVSDLAEKGPIFKEWLRLHAGPLTIEPVVLMQVQGIPYVGSDSSLANEDPADRPGFRLRLARFGLEGRVFHRVPFEITAELNSDIPGRVVIHDAWFGYDSFKFFQVIVGAHDVPFSRSALAGAGDQALIERPFAVRAMAPLHQLGAHVEGHLWDGALSYYAGVYNALERPGQFYTGYRENSALLGNRFDGFTYAGRITSEPFGSMGPSIDDVHRSTLHVAAGASAFYSAGGTSGILGMGGDILLHYKGLHVLGEILANRAAPRGTPETATAPVAVVTSIGGVGEVGYMILKERVGLNGRFELIDPATAVKDQADSWIVTGGVSYHILHDFLKAQVDYSHREEIHGKALKNDSVVVQAQLNL